MQIILVTGIHGFIGSYLARRLVKDGFRVVGIDVQPDTDGPWSDYASMVLPCSFLDEQIRKWQPSYCVHCAGPSSVGNSMLDPAADFSGSVTATQGLLDSIRREAPSCRLVYLSSAAVYGNPVSLPIHEDAPIQPVSPYGFHKRMCEWICLEFHTIYGIGTAGVRIFSAYGPGLRRQVIADICTKLEVNGNRTLELHGTGEETRDFIHVDDIVSGIRTVIDRAPFQGEFYNLASGTSIRIAYLAEMLRERVDRGGLIHFSGDRRSGDPLCWSADITKLGALGFRPAIPIETGLSEYVSWHRSLLTNLLAEAVDKSGLKGPL